MRAMYMGRPQTHRTIGFDIDVFDQAIALAAVEHEPFSGFVRRVLLKEIRAAIRDGRLPAPEKK
jgi:hypothetical protein